MNNLTFIIIFIIIIITIVVIAVKPTTSSTLPPPTPGITDTSNKSAVIMPAAPVSPTPAVAIPIPAVAYVPGTIPNSPTYTVVYSNDVTPVDLGEAITNTLFSKTMILKRDCTTCDVANSTIYYKRTTPIPANFSVYQNIKYIWASASNLLNTDFKMYNTIADLQNDTNSFQYCNYDDLNGIGGFRDCGLSGPSDTQWNSVQNPATKKVTYSVLNMPGNTTVYTPIALPTAFACVPVDNGNMSILRVGTKSNSAECLSTDGVNCNWFKTATDLDACNAKLLSLKDVVVNPVVYTPTPGKQLQDAASYTMKYFGF